MALSPVRLKVLEVLDRPRRYTEVMKESGLADKVVWQTLRYLLENEMIEKREDGSYYIHKSGRKRIESLRDLETLKHVTKTLGDISTALDKKVLKALATRDTAVTLTKVFDSFKEVNSILDPALGDTEGPKMRARLIELEEKIQDVLFEIYPQWLNERSGFDLRKGERHPYLPSNELSPYGGDPFSDGEVDFLDINALVRKLEDLRYPGLISTEADKLFQEAIEMIKEVASQKKVKEYLDKLRSKV